MATGWDNLAGACSAADATEEALRATRNALVLHRAAAAASPDEPRYAFSVARSAVRFARYLETLERSPEYLRAALDEAADAAERAARGFGSSPEAHALWGNVEWTRAQAAMGERRDRDALESLDGALARGATILGEVLGFGTNCDGEHVTAPAEPGMRGAMELALEDAGLTPADIDYVSAHGTATDIGDVAESHATAAVLGLETPIASRRTPSPSRRVCRGSVSSSSGRTS